MSVNTKSIIDGKNVSKMDLLNFLGEKFDGKPIDFDYKPYFEERNSFWVKLSGKETPRFIFAYTYSKDSFCHDYPGISDEIDIPVVLDLNQDDEAINIMQDILHEFGGYLTLSDCDDKIEYISSLNSESRPMSNIQALRVFCSNFQEGQKVFDTILSNKEFIIKALSESE